MARKERVRPDHRPQGRGHNGAPLKKLSPAHHAFILNVVARPQNQAAAYIAAGFSPGGARQSASTLLKDPLVAAEVARLIRKKHKALHMEVDEILARAAILARSSPLPLFDETGKPRPMSELTEEEAAVISGFDSNGLPRLRDPMPALRLLAEHKKLVKNDDAGVNALASAIADRLKLARERRKAKE